MNGRMTVDRKYMMTYWAQTNNYIPTRVRTPVEALSFDVDGIPMSDFVYPAYSRRSANLDR